jgi:hypothetical protein
MLEQELKAPASPVLKIAVGATMTGARIHIESAENRQARPGENGPVLKPEPAIRCRTCRRWADIAILVQPVGIADFQLTGRTLLKKAHPDPVQSGLVVYSGDLPLTEFHGWDPPSRTRAV